MYDINMNIFLKDSCVIIKEKRDIVMLYTLKERHILFVEDNEDFAQNFMTLLGLFVHKIFHCKNIATAEETLQTQKIDIIICDIKLHHENSPFRY